MMRTPTYRRCALAGAAAAGALLASAGIARAAIDIGEARYEAGVLTIRGDTQPFSTVTLDRRYEQQAGSAGRFEFILRYKPNGCIAELRAGKDAVSAKVENCVSPAEPVAPDAARGGNKP